MLTINPLIITRFPLFTARCHSFKNLIHASLFSKFHLILGNIYSRNGGSHPQSFFRSLVCISHGVSLKYLSFLLLLKQLATALFTAGGKKKFAKNILKHNEDSHVIKAA